MDFTEWSNQKKAGLLSRTTDAKRKSGNGIISKILNGTNEENATSESENGLLSKLFKGSSKDDSPTSFTEWSDNKMISAGETDINLWLRASRKLLNDYNRQAATWHDSDSYDTYHEQISKLMASASNYREQYAGNEEAIAYINDVVNALGKASNGMYDVSKYYAQWETEDDYKEAVNEQKRYEEMMSFDLEAGSAEIDDLEKKLEKAKSFTADDTYYSGNGLGGNVGAPAWNESQQKKSNCAKYLKSIGYDSVEDLEAAIAQKKQYLAVAKRSQGKSKLEADAVNAEDFERYAEQGASIKNPTVDEAEPIVSIFGWKPGAEEVKNKVTYTRDNYKEIFEEMTKAAANGSSYRDDNFNAEYMEMTDEEVKIYNYYLAKYGSSKADKYLDSLTETLRYRAAAKAFESMKGDTAQEIFFSFGAGLDQFGSGMKALFSDEDYIPPSSIQMRSGMVREDLAGKGPDFLGSSLAQTAYDLGTTTSNMLPSVAVSALIGTLNPAVGAATGSALLGTSAAGNAYSEMLNLGYNKDQARAYGSIIGTLEGGLQYVLGGVGKLGGKLSNQAISKAIEGINSGAAKFAIRYGSEMLSEGVEESLQEILSPIIQNAIFNTDESVDWEQVAYNGLLGALSAGALNFTTATANVSRENNYYKDVYNADTAEIIAAVLEKDANNKLAKTAQDKLNSGKELSGREIKQLLEQYNKSELSNDKNTIQRAAAEQLAKYGETGNIEAISAAIAKQTAGEALTRSEAKLIEDSKYGQRVANELNPENIRSGEYSSAWAEKLGTNRINAEEYGRLVPEAEQESVPADTANLYNLRPAEELALEPMDYEEQEDYLRERYAEALSDGTMSESFLNTVVSQLKSGRPLVEMIQRTDAYLQRESRAKNAEAAIRNRYADELKSGIVDENAINAMIKEIRSGAALADTIAKMDKNVKETKKYVEQRNDGNSGGVGRDAGTDTSEQSERVPERAGGDKSKERGDDARTEEARRDDSKKPKREKVSSKELNIPEGTENKTLTVVKRPGKVIDRIEKAFSGALKSITFVSGDLEVRSQDGNAIGVSALKTSDDRLFIRTDHRLYSAEKLMLHESGHLYFDEDAELRRAMHNAAVEILTEKGLERLANKYARLWWGIYPLPEGLRSSEEVAEYFDNNPDAYREFLDKYEIEIWCDALAGLDRLNAPGASKLSDDVRAIFKEQTGIDVDALLSGQESAETEAKEPKGRAAEVEQHAQSPPGSSYSIETLPDGKKYVRADRQVIFGNDPDSWCEQLEDYINGKIRRGKNVYLTAADGDILALTATSAGKLSDNHTSNGQTMSVKEYERKVSAAAHIDELAQISKKKGVVKADYDGRHGEMASGGWNYRTAYFLDFDNEYYRCRISVSIGKDGNAVYNIGEMKERSFPTAQNALNGSSANSGALGREASSQDSIRNSDEVVNSYSVDEDLELNLKLVLEGTFYSDRDEVHIGTTSNFLTREIGAEALELYMPAKKAYQAMVTENTAIFDGKPTGKGINYHGLGIKGLMDILNASENPVAAFAASPDEKGKRENRIVLVTDVRVQGGYGVVIEEMDTMARASGSQKSANKVITVYSKNDIAAATDYAIADGRILHLDKKRSQILRPGRKGSNYPTTISEADFKDNIRNFWKNVNWKKSGRKNFSSESTSEDLPEWKKQLEKYSENSFSADDAEAIAKPETQRITEISSRAKAMGINNLRERVALLDGKISGYERTDNLTERMERELEQLRAEREIYEKTLKEKKAKAKKKKQERKSAKKTAQAAADALSISYASRKSRANLRKEVFEIYAIKSGRNDVRETLDAFLDVWMERGDINDKAIQRLEDVLVDLGAIRVESSDEQAREVRERLNGGRISVPAEVVSEFGDEWESFRRRAFGNRIYLSTNPSAGYPGIDQWTMDLAASFGRGRFDTDADLKTQLEAIIETAEAGKAEKLTIAQMADYFAEKKGHDFADQYLDEIHDKLMQALKSFSQSAHVEMMELVKTNVYRTVKRNEELKQRMERAQRERDQRELQNKTLKELQWLKRNQRFMGNDFKEEAQRILANIDTIAVHAANEMNWSNKYNATWQDLVTMYKWAEANDPNFLPSKDLEYIVTRIDGLKLEDMTAADLEAVYKAAVALRTAYYNRNNVIGDALHRQFEELFEDAVSDLESAAKPKKKVGKPKRFMDSQLNPINRVRRMFGWKQDSAGTQIFGEALEKGERATKRYVEQATQMLDEWLTKNEKWVRKADGQGKDAVWYELEVPELQELHMGDKPIFGDKIKVYMTPMQKVYLYLESKNYDNLRHMVGGRTFVDKELYSAGEYDEAFAGGTTISLAPETVKQIVSDLTPKEMEFANLLDKYFNGYAKEEINRVSNILYGYDRAMSDNYAPIFSNANYTKIEPGVYQDGTAEGVGHMKTRIQGAKNPTYNISALQAFRKHVSQTSRFVGMSIPMQNAKTLLNWKMNGESMQNHITHTWSKAELDALKNVMTELQAPTYQQENELTSLLGKAMSNYIGGVFGANITVAAKVLASLPTAAIELGNKYYPTLRQRKNVDLGLIRKYTSELDIRIRGLGSPELATLTLNEGRYQRFVQSHKLTKYMLGGGLLQAVDVYNAKIMWPWAENKVKAEYPGLDVGTDEYYKKVAEVYERAISETQSMYDIMHRSDIMRNTSEIVKSFTIFHTDSLQAANLLRKRAGEYKAAKSEGNSEKTAASKKALASAIGNVILMNVLVGIFDTLRDLWRKRDDKYRDDEGDFTFWSITSEELMKLAENASGMIIGLDALIPAVESLFTGETYYEHKIIAIDAFNDIISGTREFAEATTDFISGFADVVNSGGDIWQYLTEQADYRGAVKDAAEGILHYFGGIPVKNIETLITSALGWAWPEVGAAYDGWWNSSSKGDLSKSKHLAVDIKELYDGRFDLSDSEAEELARLYESGYKTAIIGDAPSKLGDAELDAADVQAYNNAVKKYLKPLSEIMSSEEYMSASDEDKAKMLERLYDYATDLAKGKVSDEHELSSFSLSVMDWLDSGMTWAQIMSGNTADNNTSRNYIQAGVSWDVAEDIIEELSELEPEYGRDKVLTRQKVVAVAYMQIAEKEKEGALKVIYGTSAGKSYERYMIARRNGVLTADYADFITALDEVNSDGGNPTKAEFELAVKKSGLKSAAAKEIWYTYFKSQSPWG